MKEVLPVDILGILSKIGVLFLILAVGYLANRCGVFTQDAARMLSRLVLNVTLPAYLLANAMDGAALALSDVGLMLFLGLGQNLLLFLLAWLWPKLCRVPAPQVGTYRFMIAFPNVGFIGYPVVAAVLGSEAVLATSLFTLPFNLLVYAVGIPMVSSGQSHGFDPKILRAPPVIASVLAAILALLPVTWPAPLVDTCQMLGSMTTPGALLVIGSTLAEVPLRQLAGSPRLYLLTLSRLVLIPLLLWALLRPWLTDPVALGVAVLLSGMPVASNGTMFCLTYGGDQKLMSQGTFLTTLLSLLTIPLMALLLQL